VTGPPSLKLNSERDRARERFLLVKFIRARREHDIPSKEMSSSLRRNVQIIATG